MSNNKTVWSSDQGYLRKKDLTHFDKLSATPDPSPERRGGFPPPQQQTAYLLREWSGRDGSPVSIIKNLVLSDEDVKALAKRIKQECGTGGTVKNGVIEIQGEQCQRIAAILKRLGYKVKIAGRWIYQA